MERTKTSGQFVAVWSMSCLQASQTSNFFSIYFQVIVVLFCLEWKESESKVAKLSLSVGFFSNGEKKSVKELDKNFN